MQDGFNDNVRPILEPISRLKNYFFRDGDAHTEACRLFSLMLFSRKSLWALAKLFPHIKKYREGYSAWVTKMKALSAPHNGLVPLRSLFAWTTSLKLSARS